MEERERWVLWVPVFLGAGIALYFAMPGEPPPWSGLLFTLGVFGLYLLAGDRLPLRLTLGALLALGMGFTAVEARTTWLRTPILQRPLGPVPVEGRVANVERLDKGVRVTLADPRIPRQAPDLTPPAVRIRLRPTDAAPPAGTRVRILAALRPPPDSPEPGAYDFRRSAFYQGIGAVGFAFKTPEVVAPAPVGWIGWVNDRVVALRELIASRVAERLTGAPAMIAIALLNGEQTGIPPDDLQAMRVSGLQHILSISGLHISLVAALFYFFARAALALWEGVALRHPIKKYAAAFAILATLAYMMLVGAQVPTLRSVLMTALAMVAILADRSVLSPRAIAVAGILCLLYQPEQLPGPSFQMSFGAVLALISAYEVLREPMNRWRKEGGWPRRALLFVGGLCLTSIISTIATMPFCLYHFQQVANYGVLANLIGIPITELWIMPLCLLAYVAMPFHLEGWIIDMIGWGCEGILWTARVTAALPGAALHGAALSDLAFGLMVGGGLWLMLWRRRWRLIGLAPIALGCVLAPLTPRPDMVVSGGGTMVAVRDGGGKLWLSSSRGGGFEVETWGKRDGGEGRPPAWPTVGTDDGSLRCDSLGCLYHPDLYRPGPARSGGARRPVGGHRLDPRRPGGGLRQRRPGDLPRAGGRLRRPPRHRP
ncbi:ComEC/Rec2 family competence protein [Nitrospirillum sp. BR 11163]|uniref:ComEC/Rec2 family competence protein n=1 Tax=Nitrospirillum sp. BR 11163 TaxID=3104323 RepID=UPI002AFF5DDC|nr:ComEC/Rec2 family competence protein [Nitrospirillum sp. BR 11163]MEA1676487.1 ComEC/Rec2 family competence protein [Nitrospirillum sp. BR 11163]